MDGRARKREKTERAEARAESGDRKEISKRYKEIQKIHKEILGKLTHLAWKEDHERFNMDRRLIHTEYLQRALRQTVFNCTRKQKARKRKKLKKNTRRVEENQQPGTD